MSDFFGCHLIVVIECIKFSWKYLSLICVILIFGKLLLWPRPTFPKGPFRIFGIFYTSYYISSKTSMSYLCSIIAPIFLFYQKHIKRIIFKSDGRMCICPYKCSVGLGLFVHFHNGWMNRKYYHARTQRHSFRGCGSFGIVLRLQNNNIFSSMLVILLMISIKNWLSTKRRWK